MLPNAIFCTNLDLFAFVPWCHETAQAGKPY